MPKSTSTSKKLSNTRPDLSIVIPAYREEKRIGKTLDELAKYLKTQKYIMEKAVEVIVVVADAGDKTPAVVLSKQKLFTNLCLLRPGQKLGKGRDVQYGVLRAKGKVIMFMDADLATPLRHLKEFYIAYEQGSDVVIATRNLHKHQPNYIRRILSNGGNLLFRIASGVPVEDSQCGFKLFSEEAARMCFSRLTILGWGFDMEILAIAKANKLQITSIRVDDWRHVPEGTFELNLLRNFTISLIDLVKISIRRIRLDYSKNLRGTVL
jgi:dolichyl-phosphate beta-glucosyltransferase